MKTKFESAAKNFHALALRCAGGIAEGKVVKAPLDWRCYDVDVFRCQVRLYLTQRYGFSAINTEALVNEKLICVLEEKSL